MKGYIRKKRSSLIYYRYIDILLRGFARDAKSIIDIGSSTTEVLESIDWIPNKYCLDVNEVYQSENVIGIEADFLTYQPKEKFDFCTCLQVLEHVPDARTFARKLFKTANHVLISVPYMWKVGAVKGHINDPVDEDKLFTWTGRKPRYSVIVTEPFTTSKRLICYYPPLKSKISMIEIRNKTFGLSPGQASSLDH